MKKVQRNRQTGITIMLCGCHLFLMLFSLQDSNVTFPSLQCWPCTADTDCDCSARASTQYTVQASLWSQLGQVTLRIFTRGQTGNSQCWSVSGCEAVHKIAINLVWPLVPCVSKSRVIMIQRFLYC